MKVWCAGCAAYTQQSLVYTRTRSGEYRCSRCGRIKKNPRGFVPIEGRR